MSLVRNKLLSGKCTENRLIIDDLCIFYKTISISIQVCTFLAKVYFPVRLQYKIPNGVVDYSLHSARRYPDDTSDRALMYISDDR